MSNRKNPKRGDEYRCESGPRWEGPETDRNSARARSWWKKYRHRTERRNEETSPKFRFMKPGKPIQRTDE